MDDESDESIQEKVPVIGRDYRLLVFSNVSNFKPRRTLLAAA